MTTADKTDGSQAVAPPKAVPDTVVGNPGVTLSALQLAWLAEIGLDRRMLARYGGHTAAGTAVPKDASHPSVRHDINAVKRALRRGGATPAAQLSPDAGPSPKTARHDDLPSDWAMLVQQGAACDLCELHAQRDRLVFGAGDTQSPEWLIVGEAPAQSDDRTGLPFQGKAGQLLHAMMVAIGVHPASVTLGSVAAPTPKWSAPTTAYFTNIVKCRPLGNRSPTPQEIAACQPYLQQQIELLRPRRILALGRLAAQTLLDVTVELDELRGRVHQVQTRSGFRVPLLATWHPAVLLMHPQNKAQAWADLNKARSMADAPQGAS